MLSVGYFYCEICEKGGVYGGGCVLDLMFSFFIFFFYRDSNTTETLDIFIKFIEWVMNLENIIIKEFEEV